jgi:DNA-binding YbaB/EbfC family protein
MKNLGQMMKQVQEMQGKMQEMQAGLAEAELHGTSGGGMVEVVLNGHGEARSVTVDPSLLKEDEREVLEDLLVAAFNDARAKVDAHAKEKTQEIMGGLQLPPGMNLPFG